MQLLARITQKSLLEKVNVSNIYIFENTLELNEDSSEEDATASNFQYKKTLKEHK